MSRRGSVPSITSKSLSEIVQMMREQDKEKKDIKRQAEMLFKQERERMVGVIKEWIGDSFHVIDCGTVPSKECGNIIVRRLSLSGDHGCIHIDILSSSELQLLPVDPKTQEVRKDLLTEVHGISDCREDRTRFIYALAERIVFKEKP